MQEHFFKLLPSNSNGIDQFYWRQSDVITVFQ